MNHDQPEPDIADAVVSATYRSLADEAAPAELDAAILREATAAARPGKAAAGIANWLRPAVFVATAGLSLALLLEFSDSGWFDPSPPPAARTGDIYRPAAGGGDPAPPRADTTQRLPPARPAATRAQPAALDSASSPAVRSLPQAAGGSLDGVAQHCNRVQTRAPETWWQCIEALQRADRVAAAREEIERFTRAYPDFLPAR
ncbi:MAG: hypothetical protein BMS9Abin32_211 [Gammaproteobacteria bacterium]|nr:MAG: hypothetical protein BMS9Abin32_211 [Gammaproteobacteria bacterium]